MTPPIRKSPLDSPAAAPDVQASMLGLRQTLEQVVAESAAYRHEVDEFKKAQELKDAKRDAQRKRENSVAILVAIAICIPIVIMLGLLLQNLGIARDARTSAAEAKRTADTIEDCIVPTGKCYKDGSKRTGGAVINLARINEAIAICERTTGTVQALEACITARFRSIGIVLTPAP